MYENPGEAMSPCPPMSTPIDAVPSSSKKFCGKIYLIWASLIKLWEKFGKIEAKFGQK